MPTVGYEYSSPSDWTITDNEWLIEADSDITYNNPSVYKYQTADLAMLVNRLKKAEGNWPAITELLRQKADLPDNINTEDAAVRQLLVDYRYYLNAANAYLRDVNKSFRTAFDGAMLTWD